MKNNIRELRKAHQLTQEKLSELTGVSRQTIISIETGRFDPSIKLAYKLAKVFQLTIEDIFIFEEES
ncbi:helix-turn-helix transcriptional regulator [Peribacillus butanolivorans]|uniref:Transcriptional regulator n=1 Tax=Peribacillus butanolivorans TaxID=421767 RepID=A0AAX0RR16_9BACI|nr:helix-turn-helix transcriptional regulator [Peribacillus butanolivorans]AXN38655.1 transcriptional regulator [Peribacillus butanolivorans]PEJ30343.1 transcriptional regulator [Peribacillus butanolivorans]